MGGSSNPGLTGAAPHGRNRDGTPSTKGERDRWNARSKATGLSGENLYNKIQNDNAFAQQQQMMAMFAGMGEAPGGAHAPTGPSAEDVAAAAKTKGVNDLGTAFGDYMTAAEDATKFVNEKISGDRSKAALLGMEFGITDEQKAKDINNRFAENFSAEQWTALQDLNTDFGDKENPLDFLVTRGVATGTDATTTSTTGATGRTGLAAGTSGSLLDPEVAPATNLLGV